MTTDPQHFLPAIVDNFEAGIFVLDKNMQVVLWNNYMASRSGKSAPEVLGKNLFDAFPDLPKIWLEKKLRSVLVLKNFAFTSWEQRPWLFPFSHNRPITGGVDYMQQNCVFMPLKNTDTNEIEHICVTLFDVTDVAIYQRQLTEALEKLEISSITDGLTQVYNRRYLQQRLASEFARVQRSPQPLTMLMFDLDHFKKINDTYGHVGGDEVLKTVASRVKSLIRAHDVFGRYGGEEFTLILPDTDQAGAMTLAERIRLAIQAEPVMFGETPIKVSTSIGLCSVNGQFNNHEAWLQAADEALYEAKHNGRNQVRVYGLPSSGAAAP
ncbi:diguanylate cyclase [Parvibium lacunae]|uniref:sensor domain-containing diguanylate cyclase n=1 Tax=Parvibium lacunae TaxID=1888893 RepID=UPI001EFE17CB|nr:diguanylate cyclase [Parvibium lacunae]